jgi:hypothetical protein
MKNIKVIQMKNIAKIKATIYQRLYFAVAAELLFASIILVFPAGTASAAQLSARSIRMSDSSTSGGAISSGVGSGTNVKYTVQFTTTSTSTPIAGIVIDFCSNSPLPGESCTAPTGFNVNRSTTQIYNQTGLGTGTMAVTTTDTTNHRIIITRASPANPSATMSFELGSGLAGGNGITNPSGVSSTAAYTFYARIYTYGTQAAANGHTSANASGYVDLGGVALAIATVITITARVQETLTFCMSAASPSANCTSITAPAVTLGHGTGVTKVIDATVIDTGVIYSQLSTNADGGAIVRLRTSTSCGGLSSDGGTTCDIPPANSGLGVAAGNPNSTSTDMDAGTAGFGLAIAAGSGMTTAAPYGGAAASNYYGMDSTTVSNNVTTVTGSQVLSSIGPVNNSTSTWTFAATASNTTAAGIYSANMSAIATGTF